MRSIAGRQLGTDPFLILIIVLRLSPRAGLMQDRGGFGLRYSSWQLRGKDVTVRGPHWRTRRPYRRPRMAVEGTIRSWRTRGAT